MRKFFSNAFVVLGIFSLTMVVYLTWQRLTPQRLSFENIDAINFDKVVSGNENSTKAVGLIIRDLNIELPIYTSNIRKGRWEATTRGVSYLSSSPISGQIGNSIIYGHNWPNLLGNLYKAKPGQIIEIVYSDASHMKFIISYIQTVNPNQIEILKPSNDIRITLYTCTGFLDRQRFVVTAILNEKPLTSVK